MIWTVWAWFMGGPRRYKLATMGLRIGVPLLKFVPRSLHPNMLGAWTRGRKLPEVPGPDFRSWWRRNKDKCQP